LQRNQSDSGVELAGRRAAFLLHGFLHPLVLQDALQGPVQPLLPAVSGGVHVARHRKVQTAPRRRQVRRIRRCQRRKGRHQWRCEEGKHHFSGQMLLYFYLNRFMPIILDIQMEN